MQNFQDSSPEAESINQPKLISRRAVLGALAAGAGGSVLFGSGLAISSGVAQAADAPAQSQPASPLGTVGYFLSHEQFPSAALVDWGTYAEQQGFDNLWMSDHFQPWQDNEGHSGYARDTMAALGQRTNHIPIGTSVTCPTYRYRPAEVAQAFATLAQSHPGRVVLGVGTGEALNEQAATGQWGKYPERAARLVEAVTLIRQLWSGQTVTYNGKYYQTYKARLYDPPAKPIPIYIAATGPKSMRLAGQYGDGLITDPQRALDPALRIAFEEGARAAGKNPANLPIIVEAYHVVGDRAEAERWAELWRFSPKAWSDYVNVPDPVEIRRRADAEVPLKDVYKRWVISKSPDAHAQAILGLLNAGITHVQIHSPQADQRSVIDFFGKQVLPLVRQSLMDTPLLPRKLYTQGQ
jgi:TAT-translocated FGD2 family F420-dependent dehydrogenase